MVFSINFYIKQHNFHLIDYLFSLPHTWMFIIIIISYKNNTKLRHKIEWLTLWRHNHRPILSICNFHSINFFVFEHNFFPARYNLKEYVQQVHHHRLMVVVCYIIKYHKKCKPYSVTWPIQFTLHYVPCGFCVYGNVVRVDEGSSLYSKKK